jgi:hypothetical protein
MSTMNPEEIRRLPVRRELPYNGLTREQVLAIGADPDEVEAARLSQNQWAEQRAAEQQQEHVAQVLEAAQTAVLTGEATQAEVAAMLYAHGEREAQATFLADWEQEEAELRAYDAADELSFADVEQYKQMIAAVDADDRAKSMAEAETLKQQIAATQLKEITDRFEAFVQSTPGAHRSAPQIEQRLIHKIRESGIPATQAEQDVMVESAVKESVVLDSAMESLRQQTETEWRAIRKQEGARSDLMTQADIDRAKAAYMEGRMKQLADNTMIDLESLKPGPTAEEQSAALVERYRAKEEKSTDFRTQVAGVAERGRDAAATRDRGEGITEERARYKEAMARAEAEAEFGSAEIKSGYGENAVQETPNDPRLPKGYVDEYGPGGYS